MGNEVFIKAARRQVAMNQHHRDAIGWAGFQVVHPQT
jgi:hypothetical protein